MSAILFSHPRSGSSHYTAILQRHFSNRYNKQSIYLFEFFSIHCTDTFGTAGDVLWNAELYGKPLQVRVLKQSAWGLDQPLQHIRGQGFELTPLILKVETLIFKNFNDVKDWYVAECLRRLAWLKFLTSHNIHYVVKHFFLSKQINIDKELIEFAVSTKQAKLYYRRNFYQTILSHLIKTYYFDLPGSKSQISNLRSNDAHNLYNKMTPLEPMEITLEIDDILHYSDPFILFLNFAKDYKFDKTDTLVYEDFLLNKPIVVDGEEVDLKILDQSLIGDKEFPMNYAVSKDQYFTNCTLIKTVVNKKIILNHQFEIMQQLGIHLL